MKLLEKEKKLFEERTPLSRQLLPRAGRGMPAGIPTDVFYLFPYPVAVSEGLGSRIYDIDGNEYIDFSMGFGVSVWGHGNEAIAQAIGERGRRGTHFGALSEEVVSWSEELLQRFGGNWIRFSNSGTEATMDAIRFARAHTGRVPVAKIDGAYHGSHEIALVNANFPDSQKIHFRPAGEGISPRLREEVRALPFNDLEAAEAALGEGECAALILEPILFNVGAIWPDAGYLEGLREICDRSGTVLIFDETKTGHTLAWGGAEEVFGVQPDIKTLGKGIGGGVPCGAILGTGEWGYDLLQEARTPHLGTFSGTHLAAAAGVVAMRLMNKERYDDLRNLRSKLHEGLGDIISEYELPAYSIGEGAKNCLVWAEGNPLRDFSDYCRRFDGERAEALWFYMFNRGVWLAQGQDEQTTHSIAHSEGDIDRFLEIFSEAAPLLR